MLNKKLETEELETKIFPDPNNVLGCDPGALIDFNWELYVCPNCGASVNLTHFAGVAIDRYFVDQKGILYRLYRSGDAKLPCDCFSGFMMTSLIPFPFSEIQRLDREEQMREKILKQPLNA